MKLEDIKPGMKVRHYKGGEYTIIALAHDEYEYDTEFPEDSLCVVYGDGKRNWVRMVQDCLAGSFCGEASPGVERFTIIEEPTGA